MGVEYVGVLAPHLAFHARFQLVELFAGYTDAPAQAAQFALDLRRLYVEHSGLAASLVDAKEGSDSYPRTDPQAADFDLGRSFSDARRHQLPPRTYSRSDYKEPAGHALRPLHR